MATKSHFHSAVGAPSVDENGDVGAFNVFEEEGFATTRVEAWVGGERGFARRVWGGGFAFAVGDGGDIKDGRDARADTLELALGFEGCDKGVKIVVHRVTL